MFWNIVKLCVIVFLIGLIGVGFWYGRYVPFAQQSPLFEALRTTASIIFAVVGAWMAIIYPERLRFTFKPDSSKTTSMPVNMGKLLHPAVNSTFILCIVLLVGVLAPLVKQIAFLLPYKEWLRGASFGLLMALTFWQIWTVILTLVPADMIKAKVDHENAKVAGRNSFFSQTQQTNKSNNP
ncbi:hypothetical protein A7G53_00820 [Salmonella enterica]|nr:hypothetical protein [Salmonella enterica subsp. enterica]EBA4495587.1 hypothetical protein [Salmonella enterica]ECO4186706.1 hypothetical protein [Salmonella enterica]EDM9768661.1 hypothetical protein [Salmonella enterica subsp. enterica serovar Corvallis]HAF4309197.1 hypothetical protein [Salmonella enterica]